jgi:signal transduction histidine kinase
MTGLIENVLDFARARLGGGLTLNRVADARLGATLEQVIAEARAVWPEREVRSEIDLSASVNCDGARIAQMFSNLLANALTHGDPHGAVSVRARCDEDGFELSVSNEGEPIPPETIKRLFQPYTRASDRPGLHGLGLGLYIASQIAQAHAGKIEVESSTVETRFTFRMPAPQE